MELLFVAGLALVLGGAYGLYYGYRRRELYQLVTETPTTEAGRVRDPGVVELEGTVAPGDEGTFVAPLSREECVLTAWTVEEWDERGDHSGWRELASGVRSVPFGVSDTTGAVTVDPGDHADGGGFTATSTVFNSSAAKDNVAVGPVRAEFGRIPLAEEVGAEETTPDRVRGFVANADTVGEQTDSITNVVDIGNAHGDRRYYEYALSPGEEVYVLGEAVPDNPDAVGTFRSEDVTVRPTEDGVFLVSDREEQDLARQYRRYRIAVALGAVAALLGFGLFGAAFAGALL